MGLSPDVTSSLHNAGNDVIASEVKGHRGRSKHSYHQARVPLGWYPACQVHGEIGVRYIGACWHSYGSVSDR